MSATRDAYLHDVEAAVEAASCVSGDVAATSGAEGSAASALPPFQGAIVVPDELPEMPAEIVRGVLLETHKLLLTGPSKANKTWCLINLAVSVASGGRWIDFDCAQRRVLYIDLETDARTLQRRISTVTYAKGSTVEAVRRNLVVWPLRGRSCSLLEIAGELFCRCTADDFGLVVIDPAYMVQDGDENNARDIREFFARLDEICVRLQCTVAISHHHSKGAQGLKSSIDRGSGSGVFGRAPDAVLDVTELVLEPGTIEMARQSNRLAEQRRLTGWRMSFTLREFPPREPLDMWFTFPLHAVDDTGLLADCKPNYGGASEARRARQEEENAGRLTAFEAVVERMIGDGTSCERKEAQAAMGWSEPTVKKWLSESKRFETAYDPKTRRALIVRSASFGSALATENDAATSSPSGGAAGQGEGVQDALPV